MKARFPVVWMLGLLLALLVATGYVLVRADVNAPAEPDLVEPMPSQGAEDRLALVDGVEIMILESMPVQIMALVRGHLNDTVTVFDIVTQSLEGDTIVVRIHTTRGEDAMGAQVLVPFEQSIRLDIEALGLEPGTYTVDVNGVTTTLTLEAGMLGR